MEWAVQQDWTMQAKLDLGKDIQLMTTYSQ